MKSATPATGFFDLICRKRGEDVAKSELKRAAQAILAEAPNSDMGPVTAYLNSEFGEMCAREVLAGVPVAIQIEQRRGRFLRQYQRVVRRSS